MVTDDSPLSAASLSLGADLGAPFRARWVLALCLLAAAAAVFMVEALYAAIDRDLRFGLAPAFFHWDNVAKAGVAGLRGDRLDPQRQKATAAEKLASIGQLTASGLSVRPFTHVVAHLADIPVAPVVAPPADAPPPFAAGSLSFPATNGAAGGGLDDSSSAQGEGAPLGEPINVTPVPSSPPGSGPERRAIVARPGDRLEDILKASGMSATQASQAAKLYVSQTGVTRFEGGERVMMTVSRPEKRGAVSRPEILEFSVDRPNSAEWSAARADDGAFAVVAQRDASPPAAPEAVRSAEDLRETADESLKDSIYGLAKINGLDRSLVDEIARLCGHDFDLDNPVAATDRIEFLYTKNRRNEPELRFLRLTAQGRTQSYYRFTAPDDHSVDYYNRKGQSVTKFLLRRPVPGGKLNDGFGWRIHPILKVPRFHEGVDYDAPLGTPIEAAGSGVVEKIGWETGYGKYIRVRHDLGYETTYAHVEGFARGIKVGTRVRQGEVIAYVGSTGYSTGPHLYYEVRINGHNVDPLRIKLLGGRILKGPILGDFETRRKLTDEIIAASSVASNARPERASQD